MDRLLTLNDAAARLSLDRETIRRYLQAGKLKGHKIAGWKWRIKEEDLESFIKEDSNGSTEQKST